MKKKLGWYSVLLIAAIGVIFGLHFRTVHAQSGTVLYNIKQFAITNGGFTAITAPADCNYWSLTPDSNSLIRSNATDATTEAPVPGNTPEFLLGATSYPPPQQFPQHFPRYHAGDTVAFMKSVGATATVYGRFVF